MAGRRGTNGRASRDEWQGVAGQREVDGAALASRLRADKAANRGRAERAEQERDDLRAQCGDGDVKFYLGTHHPHWLADSRFVDVPLFVSHRQLGRYKTLPRAVGAWALDSGGFTELSMHGRWTLPPVEYARAVLRYRDEVGGLTWASPQDWMCEPVMLAKTGLAVEEHQRRTIASVIELRELGAPVIPVLQGWSQGQYLDHVEAYERAGLDLRAEPVVGLGSVCRRQNSMSAAVLVNSLAHEGLRLHGFGFKATGLRFCGASLASADSLAWSYHARRERPRPECVGRHINCANCPAFALEWRAEMLERLDRYTVDSAAQRTLTGVA